MTEILIKREYPANKPKKDKVYDTNIGRYFYKNKSDKWFAIGEGGVHFSREGTPKYFYEPLTIDGTDEFLKNKGIAKNYQISGHNDTIDGRNISVLKLTDLLEEFAVSRGKIPQITDASIRNIARENYGDFSTDREVGFIEGAEYYRNWIKKHNQ